MLTAILKEAWMSITSYKLRTFLTMLGIMIGVAAAQSAHHHSADRLDRIAGATVKFFAAGLRSLLEPTSPIR